MKVISCVQVDDNRMMLEFEGGFTRLFFKDTFIERVKKEPFYEENKNIIHLGYACCINS